MYENQRLAALAKALPLDVAPNIRAKRIDNMLEAGQSFSSLVSNALLHCLFLCISRATS